MYAYNSVLNNIIVPRMEYMYVVLGIVAAVGILGIIKFFKSPDYHITIEKNQYHLPASEAPGMARLTLLRYPLLNRAVVLMHTCVTSAGERERTWSTCGSRLDTSVNFRYEPVGE